MENNSFSEFVKNEILKYNWSKEQWKILVYAFLRANGAFKNSKYILTTTLLHWEKDLTKLFNKYFNLNIKPQKTKTLLKYEIVDQDFLVDFSANLGNLQIETLDKTKAYLAGIFLGKGWINSPKSKFYHLEVRVRHLSHSLDVQEAFDSIGIKTITIKKNNWFYTYVKKAIDISNVLKAINASESVMIFEDIRIERDFISTLKKMESIENYNSKKILDNSKKQMDAINKIISNKQFEKLPKDKKNLINLRIENPNYSLSELQMEFNEKYDKNISKSTINVWLKSIINISKKNGI